MLSRRSTVVLLALVATASVTGCSGGAPGASTPAATASPTAVGDRPQVEVRGPGGGDARRLALDVPAGSRASASLQVTQQVVRDGSATAVPTITIPVAVTVTGVADGQVSTTQAYGGPTVDAAGLPPADVRGVWDSLRGLAGTTSRLVVRPDGTTVEAASGADAAQEVDAELRELVPVLPTDDVGVGASWTATSVAEVSGAVVDQVATYTLRSLTGDDYVIEVSIDQTYRPGQVQGVELRSGRSTVTARLEGSLGALLPRTATGDVSTQVSYVVQQQVTEVQTTVGLTLTTS